MKDTSIIIREMADEITYLQAVNAQLLEALDAIAEGRTLVMDDIGETLADALQLDARAAIEAAKS